MTNPYYNPTGQPISAALGRAINVRSEFASIGTAFDAVADELATIATGSVSPLGTAALPSYTFTGDVNTGMWSPGPDTLGWSTGGIERMRLGSNGRLLVGTSTENTSGAKLQTSDGITFPAAAVTSADVNTLDDYEEGLWTPDIQWSTPGTAAYNVQFGRYTKIGNLVYVTCQLDWTAHTGSGSNPRINGLPFAVRSETNHSPLFQVIPINFLIATNFVPYGVGVSNQSYIQISETWLYGNGSGSPVFDSLGTLYVTGCYRAA